MKYGIIPESAKEAEIEDWKRVLEFVDKHMNEHDLFLDPKQYLILKKLILLRKISLEQNHFGVESWYQDIDEVTK